jgi:hypothetical protein
LFAHCAAADHSPRRAAWPGGIPKIASPSAALYPLANYVGNDRAIPQLRPITRISGCGNNPAMAEDRCKDGFLVPALGRIADWLNDHWLMRWLGCVFRSLKDPKPADTERYVVGWFVVGFVISLAVCLLYDRVTPVRWVVYHLATLIYLIAALRGVEIIARTTTVKDVISIQRSLVLAAINYVELMLWFGLIYAELPLPSWG